MAGIAPPGLRDFLLLPLLYYLSARIGVILSVMPEGMAILWPPNGVLLVRRVPPDCIVGIVR